MKSHETELLLFYLFFDLLILNLAITITARFSGDISPINYPDLTMYRMHGNLSWLITYFVFAKKNLYLRDSFLNRVWRITKRTLIFVMVASVIVFLGMPVSFSQTFFLKYTVCFLVVNLFFYRIFYRFLLYQRRRGVNINRALIVGTTDTCRMLRQIIDSNPILGYQFVGFAEPNPSEETIPDIPRNLESAIDQLQVQIVFVSQMLINSPLKEEEYLKICNSKGVRLRFIPENQQWFKTHVNAESAGDLVLINPQEIPLDNIGARFQKRLFDIVFSAMVIIFLFSWLFPILAILIKLNSKGPVFFIQKRTGINNKTFNCIKFRSMRVNGNADTQQATNNDARVTKIGRFFRKTNIDELPQFLNVFWGQMSVVGPRPHMLKHTEQYSALIEHYRVRHYVKPGITGWAQVNGYRGETDELWKMEERVKYDLEYINNWNFRWDLSIIWQTIFGKKTYLNAV